MEKRYIVNISVYDAVIHENEYDVSIREFRTLFGAKSFLKRIVSKFKN